MKKKPIHFVSKIKSTEKINIDLRLGRAVFIYNRNRKTCLSYRARLSGIKKKRDVSVPIVVPSSGEVLTRSGTDKEMMRGRARRK